MRITGYQKIRGNLHLIMNLSHPTESQMEKRLSILGDNERELDDMVLRDAEAFLDTKIALEESIKVVSDQIQYLDSVQQVREILMHDFLVQ